MDIMEIILLLVGGIVFVLSFLIPDKKMADVDTKGLTEDEVRAVVNRELDSLQGQIEDLVDKTERSLEKLSNEKIMAVEEYSDTVLAQIRKNHEEAVFLYDMLNNKQASMKSGIAEITRNVKEAKEVAASLEKLSRKAAVPVDKGEEKAVLPSGGKIEKDNAPKEAVEPKTPGKGLPERVSAPQGILPVRQTGDDGHNNNEKILGLYRQGKSAAAIAKELGLGVGEVKLVIDLFRD